MKLEALRRLKPRPPMWPMSRKVERQAALFGQMMERVGVNPGAAARERFAGGFAAACRRCLACRNSADCQEWLESGGSGAVPTFCPNASFLDHVGRGPAEQP